MKRSYLSAVITTTSLAAVLAIPAASDAATVTLTVADGFGASSFNSAGGWNNAAAPSAGNDYFNAGLLLRTPADSGSYTFGGDSLTITGSGLAAGNNNESLMYKGAGTAGSITINNLTINGGQLRHGSGNGDAFNLYGSLAIGANGANMGVQGAMNLYSAVSGSGTIRIHDPGSWDGVRTVTFLNSANSFNGSIELYNARSRFTLANGADLDFTIGANGINNKVFGTGIAKFNGIFNLDLSGASTTVGDSWLLVNTATLAETFGSTFSVAGFDYVGSWHWEKDLGNGSFYLFDQTTGMLSVQVPEPGTAALLLTGLGTFLALRRNRKA